MLTFNFYRPTNLLFGEGKIEELPSLVQKSERILMLYGGGSIKKNGIYDRTKKALAGYHLVEFAGIEPNPHYETCMKAVEVVQAEKISLILAVGGGSVMDAAKFIGLAAKLPSGSDAWQDAVLHSHRRQDAVPVAVIPTLAATGSEMNAGFVISNVGLTEKRAGGNPLVIPQFAIMEPSATASCDLRQTSNGIADAYVHVLEQYLTTDKGETLQSYWAEGVLKTILQVAPKLMANLADLEARAIFMHAATMALNGMISMGVTSDWATHMIGHELTILYGTDHGRTLTIVMPNLWRVRREIKMGRLAQYGRNVLDLTGSDSEVADAAIIETEKFFVSINMPIKLSQADIPADAVEAVSAKVAKRGDRFGEDGQVDSTMIHAILTLAK
ncbi:iron-containing alcohol dehydrogenase [Entomospira culicis]|uniref:Iron-containing alcohol dehydrogenase n=1 Tax=Entomospira culicis TaxID=2719989 RepID=A0A968KZF2_9SPIO|nr:iron-containing alcohol dehydrogenase [Entomospira culicis]NIZ19061.1 iron-containing alcohol dehydrogenase [Entomospira culicis]NIZ69276.1 iron-containing alcohol dehydrogenase [Entomospira culicis]WDI37859.1 iron-containing alcohol dehydrogenase [Entomospira culicis]WDI39487.1 iron-containing alcohol dehydrogenase [Entomospira culicis]